MALALQASFEVGVFGSLVLSKLGMSIGEGLPTARKFQEISCIALLHITNDL